ncbi:MAG: MBOAT family protein [Cyanothece sp. SIO1E1]|nr:MBOAT family protein [Cyanothece sp. SIO1E1]
MPKSKGQYQNLVLLLASYFFYAYWDVRYLALLVGITGVNYYLGGKIALSQAIRPKKRLLFLGVLINLGVLGCFKYFDFFLHGCRQMLEVLGIGIDTWTLSLILPLGVSFYIFQAVAYLVDVYRGEVPVSKNFVAFALFISFFPQLVAGPIERANRILPQLVQARTFSSPVAIHGLSLIAYGFFKKLVVADRLSRYVNSLFGDIGQANTISLSLGLIFFAFQIYCDFSGYSLIARGVAKLFGIELMVNFQKPYLSRDLPNFWRRWHISLSTWFKDYLYIPLGGNRVGVAKHYRNLLIVFLLSGLWHGANWTFLVWGLWHGTFMVFYIAWRKLRPVNVEVSLLMSFIKVLTLNIIVGIGWIFFRADTLQMVGEYWRKLYELDFSINLAQLTVIYGPLNLALSFGMIVLLLFSYRLPDDLKFRRISHHFVFFTFSVLTIILFGVDEAATFIYFQF